MPGRTGVTIDDGNQLLSNPAGAAGRMGSHRSAAVSAA
jgi:hypothetical protein